MIPFRKKAPPPAPAWHPDFRDVEALPDVKPVRTAFFVNGVAVFFMAVAALYLAVEEYGRNALRQEIAALEQRIGQEKDRNNAVLALHRSFQAEERYIKGVADHLAASMPASELLMALSETLHPDMAFSAIRYQDVTEGNRTVGKQLLVNGVIRATPDVATSAITDYLDSFDQHPFLADFVAEAVLTSLVPTPGGERMSFGIRLALKAGGKKGDTK